MSGDWMMTRRIVNSNLCSLIPHKIPVGGSHRSYPTSQTRRLRCKEVEDSPKGTHWQETLLPTMQGPPGGCWQGPLWRRGAQKAAVAPETCPQENLPLPHGDPVITITRYCTRTYQGPARSRALCWGCNGKPQNVFWGGPTYRCCHQGGSVPSPGVVRTKCDLSKPCPNNFFAFKILSGAANVVGPSMCFEDHV